MIVDEAMNGDLILRPETSLEESWLIRKYGSAITVGGVQFTGCTSKVYGDGITFVLHQEEE